MKWFCIVFSVTYLGFLSSHAYADRVLVNHSVSDTEVSRQFLVSVFAMRARRWSDGQRIKVLVLPDDHSSHTRFVKTSLHLFPYQLRHIWDRAIFTGSGVAPVTVATEREMLDQIRKTKGAIGYISSDFAGELDVKELVIR